MATPVPLGPRTTTWDRPPLADLSRTATLLESQRATPGATPPLTGARADSTGWVPAQALPAQLPPTSLQELRPLTATVPLVRLGTWSEAPHAQVVPAWKPLEATVRDPKLGAAFGGMPSPILQRADTTGPAAALPSSPVPLQLQRAGTVTLGSTAAPVQLQRAGTVTLGSTAAPVQLQRTGTVTLGSTAASMQLQRTVTPGPAPVQLQRTGTLTLATQPAVTLQRAPSLVVQGAPVPIVLSPQVKPQATRVWRSKAPVGPEQVPEIGRLLLQSAFAVKEQQPKQLRLVIGGLMGSGKSTICRMLRHLFKGCWINQDEFSHLGKGAKKAFLAAIEKAAADETVPVLLVDKINTMKQHREEIVHAMNRGKPGNTVFVQVKHPADGADRWDQTLRLCESRIAKRGEGHRTLKASPQLRGILQRTVNGAEALDKDELAHLRGRLIVDMTQSSIVQVMKLISDLDELDVLREEDVDVTEGQLLEALAAAKQLESELAAMGNQNQKAKEKHEKKHEKSSGPWYWAVRLEQGSSDKLLEVWQASEDGVKASASGIENKDEHHVTMLYVGGGKDEEIAARNPRLAGPQDVAKLREEFQQRQGQVLQLEVPRIIWEDGRIAAAAVLLPDQLRWLCCNDHPHITLGLGSRVNPVVSNELLARRAATEDLQKGLQSWLQQLSLGQYGPQLARWCQNMGAATPEELAEFAREAAEAVEVDEESRERLAQVLQKAVQRPIHELMFDRPLQLSGLLLGVPKGQ